MGNKVTRMALTCFKAACLVVIITAMISTIYAVGPRLETTYWPVVSKLEILSIEPVGFEKTKIRAGFRKLRNCEYVGISWFTGDRPTDFQRVSVELMREPSDTSSPNRPVGYQKAGPWIIGAPPKDVTGRSFAQLLHRCWPFWVTTTEFYP